MDRTLHRWFVITLDTSLRLLARHHRAVADHGLAALSAGAPGGTQLNTGNESVEWLYNEQLKVDDEWAIRTPNGFKWWADKHAQTVEVVGEETGPNGEIGYLISVRTEFLHDLDMTDRHVAVINGSLMSFAAMAGPVYDAKTRTVDLCSLVRVYDGISRWINPLISVAAVLQIGEARIMASEVAKALHAKSAISGHPKHGVRKRPDEMAGVIASLIAPMGQEPCKWSAAEFQSVVDKYMQQPPSLCATAGGFRLHCGVSLRRPFISMSDEGRPAAPEVSEWAFPAPVVSGERNVRRRRWTAGSFAERDGTC